jgi:hypothetical protein
MRNLHILTTKNAKFHLILTSIEYHNVRPHVSEDGTCKGEDEYDSIRLGVIYAKSTRTPNLGSRDNIGKFSIQGILVCHECVECSDYVECSEVAMATDSQSNNSSLLDSL